MKSKKAQRLKQSRRQKRLASLALVLGGGLLFGLALWAFLWKDAAQKAAIEVNGAPSLKVDREQVDLGNVKLGKTVSVAFTITNVGDQPLRFAKRPYVEVVEGC